LILKGSKDSYRQVLKSTSLFGGVQVFNILISIVRSKITALLIGTAGMGIVSLLMTTLNLIDGCTNLGLSRSSVKDMAYYKGRNDIQGVTRTVTILHRLVWFTGILGALVMIVLSHWLSKIAFDTDEYRYAFVFISLALLFKQLTNSQLAILQGMQHLKLLAKSNFSGNFFGLLITVPTYYFLDLDGIVPAIIMSSAIAFFVALYFSFKKRVEKSQISNKQAFTDGKKMIQLGITLSLSSIMTLVSAYVLQIFINARGGVDQVGLYSAGFIMLNTYVGLIFSAMGTDYYPRLSAISDNSSKVHKMVFEQAFVAILLMLPVVVIFLMVAPYLIILLYSEEFTPILGMLSWGILGMIFKTASFAMGYIIIAKGDSKVFMITSIAFNSILLSVNILGYIYGGLTGIGVSFLIYYIVHFISIKMITKMRYGFKMGKAFYDLFVICLSFCILAFLFSFIESVYLKYSLMGSITLISGMFSFNKLDKQVGIKKYIQHILSKRK